MSTINLLYAIGAKQFGANLSHLLTSEEWMNKKEIESPKLTGNFLVWIGLFLLLIVALAKFALKLF
jgi:hypothetical protein